MDEMIDDTESDDEATTMLLHDEITDSDDGGLSGDDEATPMELRDEIADTDMNLDEEVLGESITAEDRQQENDLIDRLEVHKDKQDALRLRDDLFRLIKSRLQQSRHNVEDFKPEDAEFVLPYLQSTRDSEQLISLWSRFIKTPYLISDSELCEIFDLEEQNEWSKSENGSTFYVKTLPLTPGDLHKVILECEKSSIYTTKLKTWSNIVSGVDIRTPIYLRYVGMTICGSAWNRHKLHQLRGPFGSLTKILLTHCPAVLDGLKVYKFRGGRLISRRGTESPEFRNLRDFRERACIAVFDRRSLLNSQSGGYYNDYVPSKNEAHFAKQLSGRPFALGIGLLHGPGADTTSRLQEWATQISKFAENNQAETGSDKVPLLPFRVAAILSQAIPGQYMGRAIFVFAGYNAGITHIKDSAPFWNSESSTANLLRSLFFSCARLEGYHISGSNYDFFSRLPFVDLFPWARTGCQNNAQSFFEDYCETVKPVLLLGLGWDICASLRGIKARSNAKKTFVQSIGEPQLIHYGKYRTHIMLLIPCLHPGADSYCERPLVIRQVLFYTMWIALMAAEITAEVLKSREAIEQAALCACVQDKLQKRLHRTKFAESFREIKEKLALTLRERQTGFQKVSMDQAELQDMAMNKHCLKERIVKGGFASNPESDDADSPRYLQVEKLWQTSNPDLHWHIPRDNVQEWKQWARLEVREGGSFFARTIGYAIADPDNPRRQELIDLIEPWRDQRIFDRGDWTKDPIAVSTTIAHMLRFCKGKMDRKTKLSIFTKKTVTSQTLLNGTEISIGPDCRIYLEVRRDDREYTLRIDGRTKELAPIDENDLRFVWFGTDGIDIRNKEGNSIVSVSTTKAPAEPPTIKLSRILAISTSLKEKVPSTKKGCPNRLLAAQWESETGLSFAHTLFPGLSHRGVSHNARLDPYDLGLLPDKACRPLLSANSNKEYWPYPPEYGDSCWLLKEFLDRWHPNEGILHGGQSNAWGHKPNNFWVPLQGFLLGSTYDSYPRILELRCAAHLESLATLKPNIDYCRGIARSDVDRTFDSHHSAQDGHNKSATVYYIYDKDKFVGYRRDAVARRPRKSQLWQNRL